MSNIFENREREGDTQQEGKIEIRYKRGRERFERKERERVKGIEREIESVDGNTKW